jgi:hypothetical protein
MKNKDDVIKRKQMSSFDKKNRRKQKKINQKKGFDKFKSDVRKKNPKADFKNFPLHQFIQRSQLKAKPEYGESLKYFLSKKNSFAKESANFDNNNFLVPETFSIIESYEETTVFLRKLFNSLHNQKFEEIFIDYSECKHIGIGASMCMDIILAEFINYFKESTKGMHKINVKSIQPINFDHYDIKKMLFSIGAYTNIKGFKIKFDNILDFPIRIGNKKNINLPNQREIDITQTVDYIINCLKVMNKTLTGPAETNLYKVIGEVIINADEHSDTTNRYSIGYFENAQTENEKFGIFNLSILNFGNTFYETFKNDSCENLEVLSQMKELSAKFTRRNLFFNREFEEETLWTLYALQDGVTRISDWDRGNGAIRFIESFYNLKGNDVYDNISKMVITTGHTRIIFDGTYKPIEKIRGSEGKMYKMMTFNKSGNIEEKPDSNFVKYEPNYFPGTLISVKIRIDYENTENI